MAGACVGYGKQWQGVVYTCSKVAGGGWGNKEVAKGFLFWLHSSAEVLQRNEQQRYNREHDENEASVFRYSLRDCAKNKDICRGTRVHEDILKRGFVNKCSNALATMYAKCGALVKAQELLAIHKSRDVAAWTALIAGYAQNWQGEDALKCFEQMQLEGIAADAVTFACILKACGSIRAAEQGRQIHHEIARQGLLKDNVVLGTALVDMYAKCGSLEIAHLVLQELSIRDIVCWSVLIAGYAQQGQGQQALNCLEQMNHEGLSPNAITFVGALKACSSIGAADKGEQIHYEIARLGFLGNNMVLGTALVDMYSKCGALSNARKLLEELPSRDVVSWNSLITGYAQQGQGEHALDCFEQMQCEGLSPNLVTFLCILEACGSIGAADMGEWIHHEIAKQGLLGNAMLGTALVVMYAECDTVAKAQRMLEDLPVRDVISWNALIAGYAQQGESEQALTCFEKMQCEGVSPNEVTFSSILKACGSIEAAEKGDDIHNSIARQGLLRSNVVLGSALVDMYAKCGALEKAQEVLEELPVRDTLSWNALIAGYAQEERDEQVLDCFRRMKHDGLYPNAATFSCILKACGSLAATNEGQQIHEEIARQGLLGNNIVLGNALVNMYVKCGASAKAQEVLEELPIRDVVSWNTLIAGYIQWGHFAQAWDCLQRMWCDNLSPDEATFTCEFSMCSQLCLLEDAQNCFVDMTTKHGAKPNLEHYTCMVDIFGRAGFLDKALEVIKKVPSSDRAALSALLTACKKSGDVDIGRWAFEGAIEVDGRDAGAYILMAGMYAAAGMQEDVRCIESMSMDKGGWGGQGVGLG